MTRFEETRFTNESFAPIAVGTRSELDESLHFGAGVVLDADGAVESEVGDADLVVYPRSCLKPLQADAMVAAGLQITTAQLAVACASHSGEPQHLDTVRTLLAASDLSEDDLANTVSRPLGAAARKALRAAGVPPSSLQQNCSGKHAAMLATCRVNEWPIDDYLAVDHPLQQMIGAHIETLTGEPVAHVGIDGCGAPAHAFSLRGLAVAFGTLARGSQAATAMRAHPELVGGTHRDGTEWMRAVPGLIAKEGAAAVMAAALPDGRSFAYKIADATDDARKVVMPEALRLLGVDAATIEANVQIANVDVLGHGHPVGRLAPLEWPRRG
jgi:L-asparaginase II